MKRYFLMLALAITASATAQSPCELRVVDARAAELFPIPNPPGATAARLAELRVAFSGHADPNYPALVDSFGVEYFEPWRTVPTAEGLNKVSAPVKAKLESDGSVRLPVECGRPFLHFGYAGDKKVASGLSPMATHGVMVCHGCHSNHSVEAATALKGVTAAESFAKTMAAKK